MEREALQEPLPRAAAGGDRHTAALEVPTVGALMALALVGLLDTPAQPAIYRTTYSVLASCAC